MTSKDLSLSPPSSQYAHEHVLALSPDAMSVQEEMHQVWIAKWDTNDIRDESARKYATCVREGMAKRPTADASHIDVGEQEL